MTAIKIRPVRSGDWAQFEGLVAGICLFHGDQPGLTRARFDMLACGEKAPILTLVAETEEGILAGFVAGFPVFEFQQGKTGFQVQNLFVAENFRRERIGEVLMLSIMQQARRKFGVETVKLGAQDWNEGAINFYKQLGFAENNNAKKDVRLIREMQT
jgi:ribosomal protein S18 acetylase RimI-like enzyme